MKGRLVRAGNVHFVADIVVPASVVLEMVIVCTKVVFTVGRRAVIVLVFFACEVLIFLL